MRLSHDIGIHLFPTFEAFQATLDWTFLEDPELQLHGLTVFSDAPVHSDTVDSNESTRLHLDLLAARHGLAHAKYQEELPFHLASTLPIDLPLQNIFQGETVEGKLYEV